MSYTSLSFIASVFVVAVIYYILPQKFRWTVLFLASVLFYLLNSGRLTVYLLGSTVCIYVFGLLVEREKNIFKKKKGELEKAERKAFKARQERKERALEGIAIALLLLPLLVLKYSPMAVSIANNFLSLTGSASLDLPKFALPLGISYYTLMAISYMSDVRLDKISAEKNPVKLATFTFFFPHITEGPFSRYGDLSRELFTPREAKKEKILGGILRTFYGLIKKMILADRAGFVVNAVFASPEKYSSPQVFLATVLYVVQLYAEFSGCIDIVCGVSEIFGITLPENFRQPFFSRSVDEFWRRWHISLGAYLRDYIFYPISFSKTSKKIGNKCREKLGEYYGVLVPTAIALLVVWCLIGLWHGASFKFLFYGLYYYILMMLGKFLKPLTDKLLSRLNISRDSVGYKIFDICRTNLLVTLGMLIFRADTISAAVSFVKMMFTNGIVGANLFAIENFSPKDMGIVIIGICMILLLDLIKEKDFDLKEKIVSLPVPVVLVIFVVLSYLLIIFGIYGKGSGASPFIYGQY